MLQQSGDSSVLSVQENFYFSTFQPMEIESIVKELRVDWEALISEDFDPVPLIKTLEKEGSAEASSFRNIYHKVKLAMEKVIDTNSKVFSDSVLLYSKIYRINKENLRCIDAQIDFCNEVLRTDLTVYTDRRDVRKNIWIREICSAIRECKVLLENADRAIYDKKHAYASSIVKSFLDVYARYRLNHVRSTDVLLEKARKRRLVLIDALCNELWHFMCDNSKVEYIDALDAVISLDGLGILDAYFHRSIHDIIMDTYKAILGEHRKTSTQETMYATIQDIMHITGRMFSKFLSIAAYCLENNTEVVESKFFQTETDSTFMIFNRNYVAIASEIFLKTLKDITGVFSFPNPFLKKECLFSIEDVQSSLNYEEMFDERTSIAGQLGASLIDVKPRTTVYLPFAPKIDSLFYFVENISYIEEPGLRARFQTFLATQIEEKYFVQRNNRIERKLIMYLNESGGYYDVSHDGYLEFFCKMDFAYIFYKKEHNSLGFFNFVFEIIGRKLKVLFFKVFDRRLTTTIICREDKIVFQNVLHKLKVCVAEEPIPMPHSRSRYAQVLAVIKTLRKLRDIYMENVVPMVNPQRTEESGTGSKDVGESGASEDSSIAYHISKRNTDERSTMSASHKSTTAQPAVLDLYDRLTMAYEEGCKIELVSDVMYFFDMFCRRMKSFRLCIKNISCIVSNFQESAGADKYFEYLFEVANFYVRRNLGKLDFGTVDGVQDFIENLVLLDDVLCDIKTGPKDNLYVSVDLLKKVASGNVCGEDERRFYERMMSNARALSSA